MGDRRSQPAERANLGALLEHSLHLSPMLVFTILHGIPVTLIALVSVVLYFRIPKVSLTIGASVKCRLATPD